VGVGVSFCGAGLSICLDLPERNIAESFTLAGFDGEPKAILCRLEDGLGSGGQRLGKSIYKSLKSGSGHRQFVPIRVHVSL